MAMANDGTKPGCASIAATTTHTETVMTAPTEEITLNDSVDDQEEQIAAFAALVRSSSDENYNDDHASVVSHHDERSGLLDADEHDEEDNLNGPSVEIIALESARASSSVRAEGVVAEGPPARVRIRSRPSPIEDDDDEDEERSLGPCRFLLAKIKADPALSIATIFMGVLTAIIWTNQRFRFNTRGSHASHADGHATQFEHKTKGNHKHETNHDAAPKEYPAFPYKTLLGITLRKTSAPGSAELNGISQNSAAESVEPPYDLINDFQYEQFGRKRTLLYWGEVVDAIERTQTIQKEGGLDDGSLPEGSDSLVEAWTNMSTWGPCYPRALPERFNRQRALRARQEASSSPPDWADIVQRNSDRIADEDSIVYPTYHKKYHSNRKYRSPPDESLGGLCRPGFLIIGQGKCGTSSLYHYLTGHPRVLPAREKQIHFFRYHRSQPLTWYYSHFPAIESFLGRGTLMTGEASPGYMPYPDVVESVVKRLSSHWTPGGSGGGNGVAAWKEHVQSLPKIIAILRDPISRALSSYKYNYIEPAMKKLRSGKGIAASGKPIPGKKTDRYYRRHHLFSFEQLAFAELTMLKECLRPGGRGERWSRDRFGKQSDMFFYDSVQRRNGNHSTSTNNIDSTPLIDLDEACYTATNSKAVPRAQWNDLARERPGRILDLPNLQLTQSIVGRGAYVLPLDWWYEAFSDADGESRVHVACTEDLAEDPDRVMEEVAAFLGLPKFDFANVTGVGRYNVGGHRGYDKVTEVHGDEEGGEGTTGEGPSAGADDVDLLAIPDALRNELLHFYRPYNERLFRLIGKRCPWK